MDKKIGEVKRFEIAISTNRRDLKHLLQNISKNYPFLGFLIIWQTEGRQLSVRNDIPSNVRVIASDTKGLSASRNLALKNAKYDHILLSDDDVDYCDNIKMIINKAIENYVNAAVVTFRIQTPAGGLYKKYPKKNYSHNLRTILRVSSIETLVNVKLLAKYKVEFDLDFGLGSQYMLGEEAILLSDVLRNKIDAVGLPYPVVVHSETSSSGNYDEKYMKARGALFFRIYGVLAYPLLFLFILKNHDKIARYMSIVDAMRFSFSEGRKFHLAKKRMSS